MSSTTRRLEALEDCYRPQARPSGYIDPILKAWLDTLADDDLAVLQTGLEHCEAGGDLATLPPEIRDRYEALSQSLKLFREARVQ